MNRDTLEGQWHQLKGTAHEQWGKLTNDDLEEIGGNVERLYGKLQQRYGSKRDQVEQDVKIWMDALPATRPFNGGSTPGDTTAEKHPGDNGKSGANGKSSYAKRAVDAGAESIYRGAEQARETLGHGIDRVEQATHTAQGGAHRAIDQVEGAVETLRDRVAESSTAVRESLDGASQLPAKMTKRLRTAIAAHPVQAVAIAALAGFLLGVRMRSRSS